MRIIYHCYGGAHSSVTAAAIHLGFLTLPVTSEVAIQALPYFDKHTGRDQGKLFFYGRDQHGNEVYIMGCARSAHILERTVRAALRLAGEEDDILFVNTLKSVNLLMRIGGFLSRRLGWVSLGRPLVVKGTFRAVPRLAALVRRAREQTC